MRALVALLFTGCTTFDHATMVASTATLACDWAQTHGQANDGWSEYYEKNPVLGDSPSASSIDTYFAAVAVFNIGVWLVLPPKWRSIIPTLITVAETRTIFRNIPNTGVCH